MKNLDTYPIDELCINTIRALSMDAVEKANSGHPGTPMALAPVAYLLYKKILKHNPKNPTWPDRDRFILSAGHASMLLYSVLHLCGYDISLEDLKSFRQWGSKTPGHPEVNFDLGIETTTGPLGQGFMNAVGMAIAEAHMASIYNTSNHKIVDHYFYSICSDGDLMEGASHEAAAIAGHLGLNKMIAIYDDNHITIEGKTELAYSDDVRKRFEGYHWHVQDLGDAGNDIEAIENAIKAAQDERERPSLIILRTHIAYGAPNLQDSPSAHGAPLGEEEIKAVKKAFDLPEDKTFFIHPRVYEHMQSVTENGEKAEITWKEEFKQYQNEHPKEAAQFSAALKLELPDNWQKNIPSFQSNDGPIATRNAGGMALNAIADAVPFLIGGSADLNPSTKTFIKNSDYFAKNAYQYRNIAYGVRELGMCGISNGIALHGGLLPFASTFFIFSDYARPSMRLAALMKLPVIYVMTHDSIGVGEDGPTHQPVEHLPAFRAMPNMTIIRPADANETAEAWQAALRNKTGPTILVLTRQKLPVIDRKKCADNKNVSKGAYVLAAEKGNKPQLILIGSGSEVEPCLQAREDLQKQNVDARVISMPSWELFRKQTDKYRESILPSDCKARIAVEAHTHLGWHEWVGEKGIILSVNTFGASAPYQTTFEQYGFTAKNIVDKAITLVKS
jgi:transketolase